MVFHKKKDREECDKYKGIPLVAQSGKILLKAITPGLGECCERAGILPGEQSSFRPNRSTSIMTFRNSSATGVGEEDINFIVCMTYPPYHCVRLR